MKSLVNIAPRVWKIHKYLVEVRIFFAKWIDGCTCKEVLCMVRHKLKCLILESFVTLFLW